jgi:hypothetical protein
MAMEQALNSEQYQCRVAHTYDTVPIRLCSRCASINLNQLWSSTGTKLALGTISSWSVKSCVFCKFLKDVISPMTETPLREQNVSSPERRVDLGQERSPSYHLYSMKTRKVSERLLQILEPRIIVLSNSEHGPPPKGIPHITANLDSSGPPLWMKPIQPLIDFNQPKEWLQLCDRLHVGHCGQNRDSIVSNLRLINCNTGQVVKAIGDENYVALSYVWGREAASRENFTSYPQTIQDAIIATQKLEYTWLWVDQYCMDQNDELAFQHQLQQMDAIYRQAVVTLIAAAGTHADDGLPGVSQRLRQPAPSVVMPQGYLSSLRGVPDLSHDGCKWTSRAWTFQEGLLSTKRLVFTDEQLYFECRGLYCTEMLDIPVETWEKMHHRDQPYLHSLYRVDPHMGIFPLDGCGVDPWDIYGRITEYSQRSLTYEADILKGMLGIFRAFEREKNPIRHLHGIAFPQMALLSPNSTTSEGNSKRRLPSFSESLRWKLKVPSARRDGFPSWSWTGWFGTIVWPTTYSSGAFPHRTPRRLEHPRDPKVNEKAIRVSVELRDHEIIDWNTFQTQYRDLLVSSKLSGFIYLEAYTTLAVYLRVSEGFESIMHLQREDGHATEVVVERTTIHDLRAQDTYLAVHFHRTASGNQGRNTRMAAKEGTAILKQHILIVQHIGSHWERVAIGSYVIDPDAYLHRTWQTLRLG